MTFRAGRQEPEDFSIPPGSPLVYGGALPEALTPPGLPEINRRRMRRPRNQGLAPLEFVPLPPPAAYRVELPLELLDLPLEIAEEDAPAKPLFAASTRTEEADPNALLNRFDTAYPFLLYLALAVGTQYINLDPVVRYTALWAVLLVLGTAFTLVGSGGTRRTMEAARLGWGLAFGIVFSMPLFILVNAGLAEFAGVLFGVIDGALLFQSMVFVGPLGETLFFRGAVQEQRGMPAAMLAAGLAGLAFFWPAAVATPVYLVVAVLFIVVVAGIAGFIRTRYGLAAAYVCQATINLMLLVIPLLLSR